MTTDKINIIVVEPGKPPRREAVNPGLPALSRMVGGGTTEELCPFAEPVSLIRSGNGGRLPPNYLLKNGNGEPIEVIYGTFLAVGTCRGHYVSLTDGQILWYLNEFSRNRLPPGGLKIVPLPLGEGNRGDITAIGLLVPRRVNDGAALCAERVLRLLLQMEYTLNISWMPEPADILLNLLLDWEAHLARVEDGNRWRY